MWLIIITFNLWKRGFVYQTTKKQFENEKDELLLWLLLKTTNH